MILLIISGKANFSRSSIFNSWLPQFLYIYIYSLYSSSLIFFFVFVYIKPLVCNSIIIAIMLSITRMHINIIYASMYSLMHTHTHKHTWNDRLYIRYISSMYSVHISSTYVLYRFPLCMYIHMLLLQLKTCLEAILIHF